MKILFIGDIVAKLGRETVKKVLPTLKKKERIDFVIANGENLAAGRGVSVKTLDEMLEAGIDFFTSGNHVFYQDDFTKILNDESLRIIRPANYPPDLAGRGFVVLKVKKTTLALINLSGTTLIKGPVSDPFRAADSILNSFAQAKPFLTIVDFHAELNSEKQALAFYLDGRVTAVLGTHTHVGTVDARILPKGTAYVSDVGMTGSVNSVLGVEKEIIIKNLMYPFPQKFVWAQEGETIFNGVLLEVEPSGKVKKIRRLDLNII